jgi:hypothetical protein
MHQCDINVALAGELRRKKSLTSAYPVFNIRPSFVNKSPFIFNNLHTSAPTRINAFPIASHEVMLRRCVKRG